MENNIINMIEVKKNIYACVVEDNGIGCSNSGFINIGDGILIDTMYDLKRARELKALCNKISKKHPKYIINTHSNGDHIWGNQVFQESTIIGHKTIEEDAIKENPQDFQKLKELAKISDDEGILEFARFMEPFDFEGIEIKLPDVTFEDGMFIDEGELRAEIIYKGLAHTRGDSMVWLEDEKVLFTGDLLFNKCTPILWIGISISNWIEILDYIVDVLKPDVIVPGHGPLAQIDDVISFKAYLKKILSDTVKLYETGIKDPMEISKNIDITEFINWTEPERLYINVLSVIKGIEKDFSPMNFIEISKKIKELRKFLNM